MELNAEVKCEVNDSTVQCINSSTVTVSLSTIIEVEDKFEVSNKFVSETTSAIKTELNDDRVERNVNDSDNVISRLRLFKKNSHKRFSKECYYIKSILLLCPSCGMSFRGGRTRLPCLHKHVFTSHRKICTSLLKVINKKYGVQENCCCFACRSNRNSYESGNSGVHL